MPPIQSIAQLSQDTLQLFKDATGNDKGQPLAKATTTQGISQATGLVWYDLQAPAKNLFPVITPLVNMIPRVTGAGGTATNWKAVTGVNVTNMEGFVPEGVRDGVTSTSEEDYSAAYKTLGAEDYVTFEAVNAAINLENIRSTTAQRLLWNAMIRQERAHLASNLSVALGTPTAPTCTPAATDGNIPDATYNVIVVALSANGYMAASVAGGIPALVSVTPADGAAAFTYGGGSSQKSAATAVECAGSNQNTISATVPVVRGAVAYAWFVGTAGNEKITAITTLNSVVITTLAGQGTQNASAITADNSKNLRGYDGLLYQAFISANNAYYQALATGTPGVGTKLTTNNSGGVAEIDAFFKDRWDLYRLSPTHLFVNSQELDTITTLVVKNGGSPLIRLNGDFKQAASEIVAGTVVGSYLNRYTMAGGQLVKLVLHPNMPPGTIFGFTDVLPYPINNVPNVAEYRYRQDWYQLEWPIRTRRYETGVYTDGVLAHYFPPSLGIITNIAPGV